jgi:hypothetical protein
LKNAEILAPFNATHGGKAMLAPISSFINFQKERSARQYAPIYQFPWVERYSPYLSWGFTAVFILVTCATVLGWQFLESNSVWWLAIKITYFGWTIAVPLWMFLEVVWGFRPVFPTDKEYPEYVKELEVLKVKQDAARPVWAGAAAALGILLLKAGGG